MIPTQQRTKVPSRTIGSAIVMFAGIVLLAYGYFQDARAILYAGLVMTLAGVLTGIIFSVLWRHPQDGSNTVR